MVVGSIVFAANTGLGILARSFYDNGVVNKVFIVAHPKYGKNEDWYEDEDVCNSLRELISSVDTVLLFEVADLLNGTDWAIMEAIQKAGKRVVLMPMYESTPTPEYIDPDLWLFPSKLDELAYRKKGIYGQTLPIPVDVPWRLRSKAEVFIHNAGSSGSQYMDRNGTEVLLKALPYVKSDAKIIIRGRDIRFNDLNLPNVTTVSQDIPYSELWNEGDAFIFPERINGLCLPLQEAHAAGMLVIAGNRFPVNCWLPNEPLIPVTETLVTGKYWQDVMMADYNAESLAASIDSWYGRDITCFSEVGQAWAKQNSWDKLRGKYLELL